MPPLCPIHKTPLLCPRCAGAEGGSSTSDAKVKAARENGKKGGRPKGSKNSKPS